MGCVKQADYLSDQIILRSLAGLLVLPPLSNRRDSTPIFCLRSQKPRGVMSRGGIIEAGNTVSLENVNTEIFSRGAEKGGHSWSVSGYF